MAGTAGPQQQRISVALATYNGSKYLREQLDSLARQTLPPLEVVVTDEGSQDDTLEILREFAGRVDFPVHIHQNPSRLGFANNFMKAASLCAGPLIAFCDQDDRWEDRKLAVCAEFFQDPDVMLCVHSGAVWDGTSTTGAYFPHFAQTAVHPPASLDPFFLIPGFAMMFRWELLELAANRSRIPHLLNPDPNAPMHHDSWLWLLGMYAGKVATISDSLVLYRQHGSNTIGVPPELTRVQALLLTLSDTDYTRLARFEAEFAELLLGLSSELSGDAKARTMQASEDYARLASYHGLRSGIYDRSSNLFARAKSFSRLVNVGAYASARGKFGLGSRAALKDLLFGVTAIYRLAKGFKSA